MKFKINRADHQQERREPELQTLLHVLQSITIQHQILLSYMIPATDNTGEKPSPLLSWYLISKKSGRNNVLNPRIKLPQAI